MSTKRSTFLKVNAAAPAAATSTFLVAPPAWARKATLIVAATTAAVSTVDAKVQQGTPNKTATEYNDTGVAIDQIAAGSTAVSRAAAWGDQGAATAGTSIDVFVIPLSAHQRVSYTVAGTVTNLKIWVEFEGE